MYRASMFVFAAYVRLLIVCIVQYLHVCSCTYLERHGIIYNCNLKFYRLSLSKMFGALNRFISRLDSESPSRSSRQGHPSYGFQVLRNKNQEIAIDPWYDFVIGINGRQIVRRESESHPERLTDGAQDDPDQNLFATEIRNCAGSTVALAVWNPKVYDDLRRSLRLAYLPLKHSIGAAYPNPPHPCPYAIPNPRPHLAMDSPFLNRRRMAHPRRDPKLPSGPRRPITLWRLHCWYP